MCPLCATEEKASLELISGQPWKRRKHAYFAITLGRHSLILENEGRSFLENWCVRIVNQMDGKLAFGWYRPNEEGEEELGL